MCQTKPREFLVIVWIEEASSNYRVKRIWFGQELDGEKFVSNLNAWSHGDDMSAIEHILLVVANDLFYLFLLFFLSFSIFSLDIGGRNRPSQLLLTKSTSTCQLTCYVHFSSQDSRNIISFSNWNSMQYIFYYKTMQFPLYC